MKKRITLSIIFLVILVGGITIGINTQATTLEDALDFSSLAPMRVIHEEKLEEGSLFFCFNEKEDTIYTAFIKKTINGYKNLYSGVEGDATYASNRLDFTETYFPAIEKTSLPVYFGLIGNDEIKEIKVKALDSNEVGESAKIIETPVGRIWLQPMTEYSGSKFEIQALSEDGQLIKQIETSIAPWAADDEPKPSAY